MCGETGSSAFVARSGDSATNNPGAAGAVFGSLGPPVVDETGGVGLFINTPSGSAGTGYFAYGRPGQGLRCVA